MMTIQYSFRTKSLRMVRRMYRIGLLLVVVLPFGLISSTSAASAATPTATGWIRFAHFAPSAGPVDIWVDGSVVLQDSSFKDVGTYISLPVGSYVVAVRPTGAPASTAAITTGTAMVNASTAITAAIVDENGALRLEMINDDLSAPPPGDAKIRLIQSSPGLGSVSGSLLPTSSSAIGATASDTSSEPTSTDSLRVSDVAFGSASPYVAVPDGTYQVSVTHPGSTDPLVMGSNLPVAAGAVVSVVVLGPSTAPTIEVLSDAVGASTMPIGGMHTGFGGTAEDGSRSSSILPSLVTGTLGFALFAVLLRRRLVHPKANRGG